MSDGRDGSATPGTFVFNANAHEPGAAAAAGQDLSETLAWRRARRRWRISPGIPRPRNSSPPNSPGTSSPTIRRRRWWRGWRSCFRKSDGDLKALATALLDADEAWAAPLTKVRSPYEFLVATGRLLARVPEDPAPLSRRPQRAGPAAVVAGGSERISRQQRRLGRTRGHEAAARHLGAVGLASRRHVSTPATLLEFALADAASQETRRAVERAESRQQAMALLLMSPEFQRR